MKLMTIVVPDNNHDYSIDQIYSNELINVVNESDHKGSSLPTLIYTYELAKRLYPDTKFSILDEGGEIEVGVSWCFGSKERKSDYIFKYIDRVVEDFLFYIDNGIDPVFDDFDVETFIGGLYPYPLIHKGKYEIYFVEMLKGNKVVVSSLKKDALIYAGYDPDEFFYTAIEMLDGECFVLSTDEFDFDMSHSIPLFVVDFIQAKSGDVLTIDRLNDQLPMMTTKGGILTYYLKLAHYHNIIPFIVGRTQ